MIFTGIISIDVQIEASNIEEAASILNERLMKIDIGDDRITAYDDHWEIN